MATFSPSAAVQLAINAAREAGLLDAPVRFARPLADSGTPLQIYLANGRVILWPPAGAAEPVATDPPAPSELDVYKRQSRRRAAWPVDRRHPRHDGRQHDPRRPAAGQGHRRCV